MTNAEPLPEQGDKKRTRQISMEFVSAPGNVFVFGSGDTGQLGLGDSMLTRKRPMPLKVLDDKEIVDIACGGMHSIALTKEGKLYSWGCNDQRALGRSGEEYLPELVKISDDVKFVKIACGDSISMALSDTGKVYCWGTYRCAEGALGFSIDQAVQDVPAIFKPLSSHVIVDIAAGTDHCLALTDGGRVFGWGNGQQFQLGRRVIERRKKNGLRPELLALKGIKAIGTGSYHSFALDENNDLYVWGLNNYQQCGLLSEDRRYAGEIITTPTVIPGLQGKGPIKSVAAGEHHSYVLMEDGTVYSFGRADSSQLGLPESMINQLHPQEDDQDASKSQFKKAIGQPTLIPGLTDVIQISSGSNHALVTTESGKAYAWGFGEMYALGNGSDEDEPVPCEVTGQKLEGHKVIRVSAGAQHSVILANSL
ncbi:regulator of chromosome condensation 1/beta-lactamase-inhibitor protein II [Halteromyces radiatus]|uniref:regulator of chromosome condensation 1/beta-lactamase-inhibitor protein II n=1 Tax=Halteromyces radiatus TaxID=101107 RepID=UPI00221EAB93|nr:regulator of chromosome condensation 1/beta-lactamase-inhibitor protein II [Halteromyces radiatus]KAI8085986.1 regulator of chromosome condensation 1/beta-lactamase-inhibitor protein II [Halteromyces radiatus]